MVVRFSPTCSKAAGAIAHNHINHMQNSRAICTQMCLTCLSWCVNVSCKHVEASRCADILIKSEFSRILQQIWSLHLN